MRLTRRVVINTIAFGGLSLLLIVVMAFQVLPTVFGSTYSIFGIFTAAGGVATNQEVTYRGVQVGRVGQMSLVNDGVKIELIIESGFKIPKDDTKARVLFKSAVGEQFVDLLPERDGAPFFAQGDVIPAEATSIPIQIEDLLRQLDAVIRSLDPETVANLVNELGAGLTGHGKDIRDIILSLDTIAKVGVERRGDIVSTIGNAANIQDSFNASREDFVRAIAALRTVVDTLADHRVDIEQTVARARSLDTEIIALLDNRRAELNRIIADLGTVTRISHAHRGDLNKILGFLGPFLSDAYSGYDAPYFVFNLLTNSEAPSCAYDPSSRPIRSVFDTTPKQPATEFGCEGGDTVSAAGSRPSVLSPQLQVLLDRVSWLKLFTLGY